MKLARVMVALVVAVSAAPALAQAQRPGGTADGRPSTMDFDPAVVEAQRSQPQGGVLTVRVVPVRSLLIEVRKGFDERILETADDL